MRFPTNNLNYPQNQKNPVPTIPVWKDTQPKSFLLFEKITIIYKPLVFNIKILVIVGIASIQTKQPYLAIYIWCKNYLKKAKTSYGMNPSHDKIIRRKDDVPTIDWDTKIAYDYDLLITSSRLGTI